MKTEYTKKPVSLGDGPSAVAAGSFDGVHLGHGRILSRLVRYARERHCRSVAMTFDPHPGEVLSGEGPGLLNTPEEKDERIARFEPDHLITLKFDRELAAHNAEEFVTRYLIEPLNLVHLVMGEDHHLGRKGGSPEELERLGGKLGFTVDIVSPVCRDGEPVKSTRIRNALREGRIIEVAEMLGYPYTIAGSAVSGEGRGRELGFPTVNLKVHGKKLLPPPGVYAAADGEDIPGLLYIGTRPTFGGGPLSVEFHCLQEADYSPGDEVRLSVHRRIRGEMKFESGEELVGRMEVDRSILLNLIDNFEINGKQKRNSYKEEVS